MAGWNDETLLWSNRHASETHQRWAHRHATPRYRAILTTDTDDWIENQCGGCAFYVALEGAQGADYGVCTNGKSAFDGTVKFEHDGCEAHEYQPLVTVEDLESYRDALRVKLGPAYRAMLKKDDAEELARVEKLLPDTAAQSAAPPPTTSRT